MADARAKYPHLEERFIAVNCLIPEEMGDAFDVVLQHNYMSELPPTLRAEYRRGIDLTLRREAC